MVTPRGCFTPRCNHREKLTNYVTGVKELGLVRPIIQIGRNLFMAFTNISVNICILRGFGIAPDDEILGSLVNMA